MTRYVTVDGGTTNTRVCLVLDGDVKDTVRIPLGAKANGEKKGVLDAALKDAIEEILKRNGLKEEDVSQVLASGMVTSEMGLCPVAHLEAPVGVEELHKAITQCVLSHITSIPFSFVTGVKTIGTLSETDLMRGEETELYGLFDTPPADSVVILPGSHSKIVRTDKEGRIHSFLTMLTGEMLASLSAGTVLSQSITLKEGTLEKNALIEGYEYAEQQGLNAALFKVRVMRVSFGASHGEAYSFFLGAVLHDEIRAVLHQNPSAVYIGGRAEIKAATAELLQSLAHVAVHTLSDEAVNASVANGLIKIYEYKM